MNAICIIVNKCHCLIVFGRQGYMVRTFAKKYLYQNHVLSVNFPSRKYVEYRINSLLKREVEALTASNVAC